MMRLIFSLFLAASVVVPARAQSWNTPIDQDLFQVYDQLKTTLATPEDFARRTEELVRAARETPPSSRQERRRATITELEAANLLNDMMEHPVVGLAIEKKYDPTLRFGFCFGRAAWAHIELLRRGVAKDSIKKIFVVGPMASDGLKWQFHVAAMARLPDGDWITIDSDLKKTLRLNEWIREVNKMSVDGKLAYFVTEPARLGASTTVKINPTMFRHPLNDAMYNQYFEDMMAEFRKASKTKAPAPVSCRGVFSATAP
ncbi:MAG: hypothetical protein KF802_05875 [Bdellovibrionaceae bacterium]|nr:hypothetical protein [Pseudobdellovibrionaceae bacterium]